MTGAGKFIEVQGTAEGAAFSRDRARRRCSTSPSTGSTRSSSCSARCSRCRPRRAGSDACGSSSRPANPDKAREIRAVLDARRRRRRAGPAPDDVPEVEETGDDAASRTRGSRPRRCATRPASRRSPTTPASRSTRSAARPASAAPATPARTRPTPTTSTKLLAEMDAVRRASRTARFRTVGRARAARRLASSSPTASSRA